MKSSKFCSSFSILTLLLVFFIFSCGQNNSLYGKFTSTIDNFTEYVIYDSYNDYYFGIIEFSGKNYKLTYNSTSGRGWSNDFREDNGTYSITDNQLELIRSNGEINVYSFSRTDNTITIDGVLFKRIK